MPNEKPMANWMDCHCKFCEETLEESLKRWAQEREVFQEQENEMNELRTEAFPSSTTEIVLAEIEELGSRRQNQAWILSDRDVWMKNPYYKGPYVEHPEMEW